MNSHQYEFTARDVIRMLWPAFLPLVVFSLAMHLGAKANLLPRPRAMLDMDRTILLQKAEMTAGGPEAEIVLIGDSSCMMDLSALALERALGRSVVNLGTLSYVDLGMQAGLLKRYMESHPPGAVKTVVLLMHPEALRLAAGNAYFTNVLAAFFQEKDFCDPRESKLVCWLGGDIFKGRILTRLVPTPLPGLYGSYYGFTWNLREHLVRNKGSAVDPRQFNQKQLQGNPEYRLGNKLEEMSKQFRNALPSGISLTVGITPSPKGFVFPNHVEKTRVMLNEWGSWLRADVLLTNMPTVLEDESFAHLTHLSEKRVEEYTRQLAIELEKSLKPSADPVLP